MGPWGAGRYVGGVGRLLGSPWCGVFWDPLEPSAVVFITVKSDFI
jgi:hypothetical protein